MAQPGKQPKAMSSRLLTMKFMQRAAASFSSSPSTPSEPPSKKQRLSNGSYNSPPSSIPRTDAQAVAEALAAEERKRTEALEREAADRGETKWYLSIKQREVPISEPSLRVVSAGYSTLDAAASAKERSSEEDDSETTRPSIAGRRSFGKFNTTVEKSQNPDASSSASDTDSGSDEEDEDENDDPTGAKALIAQFRKAASDKLRAERKAKKQSEKAEALRLIEERRKKAVKLNSITSISANSGGRSLGTKDIACHQCGQKGHVQRDCPQSQRQRKRKH